MKLKQRTFCAAFYDGTLLAEFLFEAASHGIMPDYIGKLLAVFEAEEQFLLNRKYIKREKRLDISNRP